MPAQPDHTYQITGGRPVSGAIRVLGAKNFATKAMVAALLGDTPTTLTNLPPIGDVSITADMLSGIGTAITFLDSNTIVINPTGVRTGRIPLPDSGSNRVPILLLGALLHRFDEISVPVLGGCNIGTRNVDFHVGAIELFGGRVTTTEEGFTARKSARLTGTQVTLPYPSVGATETCLYLAVLARGRTVISNAAIEPEIQELITMLRMMGAIVYTSPGRDITVEGVPSLHGTVMNILGDRIEAASWACLACASDGEITTEGIRPDTMGNFLSYFQQVGGGVELLGPETIRFTRSRQLQAAVIETDVYPGFSTDWQQPFAVLLTQAHGMSVIHETVYENRFGYLRDLAALGARAELTTHCLGGAPCRFRNHNHEHSAVILGPTPLTASSELRIPDLRAGLAYVIVAAIAEGATTLYGTEFVERGYGDIVPRLSALNLQIRRVPSGVPAGRA